MDAADLYGELPPPVSLLGKHCAAVGGNGKQTVYLIAKAMAVTAYEMKGQPWQQVEMVLGHHRLVLATVDARWLKD